METMDYTLIETSPPEWLDTVMADFDSFLLDHASCEKKASGMAMSMISHYPDKPDILKAMLSLAVEELHHFRDVMQIILDKGLVPGADTRDPYVNQLHNFLGNNNSEQFLLNRLLLASIVEARGAERFGLVADALADGKLKKFYMAIAQSEARHYLLFLDLANKYFEEQVIQTRLDELLQLEAGIIRSLPLRAALH